MKLYKVVRFYQNSGRQRVMRRNLSLAEAQAWCSREDTRGPGWFDGFTEQ
jgi:hypothetical protein